MTKDNDKGDKGENNKKDDRTLPQVFLDKFVEDTMNPLKTPFKILTHILFGR